MSKKGEDVLVEIGKSLWDEWVTPCYNDFFSTHDKNNKQHQDEFNRMMNDIIRRYSAWSEGE